MKDFIKYLSVSEVERKWGFYITTAGYRKTLPHEIYPNRHQHPRSHSFTWKKGRVLDDYHLVFISSGQGIFETERSGSHPIMAGTVFFLFPGVWHRYKPDSHSGWEEYWIGFKGNYPEALMSERFFNPDQPFVHAGPNEQLVHLLHQLLERIQSEEMGYPQIISGIALQILGLLHSISLTSANGSESSESLVLKARFLLNESVMKKVSMQELAKQLPMGYSSFRKVFKSETGQSPNQYLLDIRLNKAKELLRSTDLHVNEIAYQTGFISIFNFSKLFKKKTGFSPAAYRKEQGAPMQKRRVA